MIVAQLRAGCDIRLGFPHHGAEPPADQLRAVADYMDREGFAPEMYLGGPMVAALEAKIPALLGKPAAMRSPIGTLAQGIAVRLPSDATGCESIQPHPTSTLEWTADRPCYTSDGAA